MSTKATVDARSVRCGIPHATVGRFHVEPYTDTAGDQWTQLRAGRTVWMDDSPDTTENLQPLFDNAAGKVLLSGLGLGVALRGLLQLDRVTTIDVVELHPEVVELVAPAFRSYQRVNVYTGDALTFPWGAESRWDFAWHDGWDHPPTPAEAKLYLDRFAGQAERQACWGLQEVE